MLKKLFLSLRAMQLEPAGAKLATISLLIFSITGISLSSFIKPEIPGGHVVNLLPIILGITSLVYVLKQKDGLSIKKASVVYLINVGAVVIALYVVDQKFALHPRWFPFQANKLGCLVTAILCPSLYMGSLGILLHAGSSVINFTRLPEHVQRGIAFPEPIGIIAFGLAGFILLYFRFRRIQLAHEVIEAHNETRTMKELAKASLKLRDLMNTPLQNIEIAAHLQRQVKTYDAKVQDSLDAAIADLKDISKSLKSYDALIEWGESATREMFQPEVTQLPDDSKPHSMT